MFRGAGRRSRLAEVGHNRRALASTLDTTLTTQPGMTPGRDLADKVVLITGGARNIGRAIARSLAAGGARVMINARTSTAEADETVAMIMDAGGDAASCIGDVTNAASVARIVDATVTRFGQLDALVHNAGLRGEQPFAALSYEEWRRVLAVVLDGAFLCAQAALPHLRRSKAGSI